MKRRRWGRGGSAGATSVDLTASLVAFWKLGEASGTRFDSVGSNDLTDNNTVTQAAGKIGNAANFVSANQEYLSSVDTDDLSTGDIDFIIAGWVLFDATVASNAIISKRGGADIEYQINLNAGGSVWNAHWGGTTFGTVQKTFAVTTGVWYHFVFWHDATLSTGNLKINEETVASAADLASGFGTSQTLAMGYDNSGDHGNDIDGRIDAVGLWKGFVPDDAWLAALYNNGDGWEPS